jgi:NAD(P)H dehydrogenase (quinone)
MTNFTNAPLLVTGASGNLGRIAVEELLARGAKRIIAGTRDPSKLEDLASRGVEVRKVDFGEPASLAAAFAGVERLLLVSTDGIGKRVAQQTAAVDSAKAAGIKHIVYTSAPAARPNADAGLNPEHFWTESAIYASGLGFTILRNHMYAENNLMDGPQAVASGHLFGLIGDRGTAYVTRADAARTAAGALLTAGQSTVEDVTGPAPVTNAERATIFSELSGRTVSSVPLTAADLKKGMVAAGIPDGFAEALVAFQRDAVTGYHGVVTDVVERYSGRKPRALKDFLLEHKAVFAR